MNFKRTFTNKKITKFKQVNELKMFIKYKKCKFRKVHENQSKKVQVFRKRKRKGTKPIKREKGLEGFRKPATGPLSTFKWVGPRRIEVLKTSVRVSTAERLKPSLICSRTRLVTDRIKEKRTNRTNKRKKNVTQPDPSYHSYTLLGCSRTFIFILNIERT